MTNYPNLDAEVERLFRMYERLKGEKQLTKGNENDTRTRQARIGAFKGGKY